MAAFINTKANMFGRSGGILEMNFHQAFPIAFKVFKLKIIVWKTLCYIFFLRSLWTSKWLLQINQIPDAFFSTLTKLLTVTSANNRKIVFFSPTANIWKYARYEGNNVVGSYVYCHYPLKKFPIISEKEGKKAFRMQHEGVIISTMLLLFD